MTKRKSRPKAQSPSVRAHRVERNHAPLGVCRDVRRHQQEYHLLGGQLAPADLIHDRLAVAHGRQPLRVAGGDVLDRAQVQGVVLLAGREQEVRLIDVHLVGVGRLCGRLGLTADGALALGLRNVQP